MAQSACPSVSSLRANATEAGGKTRVRVTSDNRSWLGQRNRVKAEDWQRMTLRGMSNQDGPVVSCLYQIGEDENDTLKMLSRNPEAGAR